MAFPPSDKLCHAVGLDSEKNMCRTRSCGGGRVGNSLWRRRRILENRWCGAGVSQSVMKQLRHSIPSTLSQRFPSSSFLSDHLTARSSFVSSHNLVASLSFPPNPSTYFHEAHKKIVCFRLQISRSLLSQPMQSLQYALNEPNLKQIDSHMVN